MKEATYPNTAVYFLYSGWGEHSPWNGKASSDKAFSRVYTPKSTHSPSISVIPVWVESNIHSYSE